MTRIRQHLRRGLIGILGVFTLIGLTLCATEGGRRYVAEIRFWNGHPILPQTSDAKIQQKNKWISKTFRGRLQYHRMVVKVDQRFPNQEALNFDFRKDPFYIADVPIRSNEILSHVVVPMTGHWSWIGNAEIRVGKLLFSVWNITDGSAASGPETLRNFFVLNLGEIGRPEPLIQHISAACNTQKDLALLFWDQTATGIDIVCIDGLYHTRVFPEVGPQERLLSFQTEQLRELIGVQKGDQNSYLASIYNEISAAISKNHKLIATVFPILFPEGPHKNLDGTVSYRYDDQTRASYLVLWSIDQHKILNRRELDIGCKFLKFEENDSKLSCHDYGGYGRDARIRLVPTPDGISTLLLDTVFGRIPGNWVSYTRTDQMLYFTTPNYFDVQSLRRVKGPQPGIFGVADSLSIGDGRSLVVAAGDGPLRILVSEISRNDERSPKLELIPIGGNKYHGWKLFDISDDRRWITFAETGRDGALHLVNLKHPL